MLKNYPVKPSLPVWIFLLFVCAILTVAVGGVCSGESPTPQVNGTPAIEPSIELTEEERQWIQANPEITVSNEFDWPPFDFMVAGEPQGFGIDLMRLLSERSGLQFKYVNGFTWDELVEMFFAGKIDLLHSLSITPEREEEAFFSPPYYHSKNVLILRRDTEDTNDLEDLDGKIIALPKGWSSIQFFETYYPEVHIIEVESSRQALEYVDQGKVFATVEQEGIAAYFIKKFGFNDLKLSSWIDNDELQKTSSMHFAVLRNKPLLFGILDKALSTVQPEDMSRLTKKWFSRSGRGIGSEDVGLTPNERLFLEEKKSVTYCIAPDRMPLEGYEDGMVSGMTSDFMEMFSERLGVPFINVPTNTWAESLDFVRNGQCEILPMVNETPGLKQYLSFTTSYLSFGVAIIAREDQPFIGGMDDLKGMKVAVPANSFIEEMVIRRYPALQLIATPDPKQCLRALVSGSVDSVLLSMPVASYYIRHMGLSDLKVAGVTGSKDTVRIGVKKGNGQLHSVMSKVARALPMPDVEDVSQKWVSLKFEHKVDYGLMFKILAVISVFVTLIIIWNWQLVRLNRKLAETHNELEEKSRELERLSITDSLTKLYNRRYIEKTLQKEIDRHKRYQHGLAVILIDLDNFKTVNDTFGHQAGDVFLTTFATLLTDNSRKTDIVGRWGGEEFVILCPENSLDAAALKAEYLRIFLAEMEFAEIGKQTASFGVAGWQDGETVQSLIGRADAALYRAKDDGRNRVVKG